MSSTAILWILGALIPALHLLGLALAIHAILTTRTSQGAIAWALSLVFFPYVSVILYLVFGRTKFHGYVEAHRRGNSTLDHLAADLRNRLQQHRAELAGADERFAVFESLGLFPFTAGNATRLLIDGDATFDAIFAAIDAATECILVQFFIVRNDALGDALRDRLIRKARSGVKVYFLFDEIGSLWLPKRYIAELRAAGVSAKPFNTRRGWLNPFQINFRNHRKIVLVDGQVAFVGGHNVGVEYLGQSKRFGHWRDTHIEVRGPAVAAIQWSFVQDWHWATDEILQPPGVCTARPERDSPAPAGGKAMVLPTSPALDVSICSLMLLAAISAARRRVWITSPYFVPDETVYDALQLAAMRGVDVRIMLPARPDHLLVYLSSFSYLASGESVGVKFYRYRAGFLHQKVFLVDDDLAAVGTANLDNRSMRLNFELTVLVADGAFAAQVSRMLEEDFGRCVRADKAELGKRGRRNVVFRAAVQVARLLSPIQ
ncbi:MAG TPA: cardiolipin synthase [Phycisphaerae bacterium]|nr:cardiolipin synthase [Phycisphaerae bacterium]